MRRHAHGAQACGPERCQWTNVSSRPRLRSLQPRVLRVTPPRRQLQACEPRLAAHRGQRLPREWMTLPEVVYTLVTQVQAGVLSTMLGRAAGLLPARRRKSIVSCRLSGRSDGRVRALAAGMNRATQRPTHTPELHLRCRTQAESGLPQPSACAIAAAAPEQHPSAAR